MLFLKQSYGILILPQDPLALHLWWACERREGCAPHFPPEHPLEELRRALLAALLYHTGLKEHALATAIAGMFIHLHEQLAFMYCNYQKYLWIRAVACDIPVTF